VSIDAATFSILWPAFIAGLLVTATHVPLGMQVLERASSSSIWQSRRSRVSA